MSPETGQPLKDQVRKKAIHAVDTAAPTNNGETNHQVLFVGSNSAFTFEKTVLQDGQFAGRTAFIIDPVPPAKNVFPFMGLPFEIRLMVYRDVLVLLSKKYIHGGHRIQPAQFTMVARPLHTKGSSTRRVGIKTTEPELKTIISLLHVDRRIRAEALPIFLGANTFIFGRSALCTIFLDLFATQRNFVKRLEITDKIIIRSARSFSFALANLMHLEELVLPATCLEPDNAVLFEEYFYTAEIMGPLAPGKEYQAVERFMGVLDTKHSCVVCGKVTKKGCGLRRAHPCKHDCCAIVTRLLTDFESELYKVMGWTRREVRE
ncbi:hypothetical protein CAC42_4548 [Sphaceloma murrayae]|uniref:Uncharacterized protein n=1 Tax=Sphaceloma murrayae TaxID=2082308 RepID=A0A2K1QLW0_9PEZI|nr:hypothetical protein CAC42_4548 [Sphaceloma murrayae]